MIMCTVVVVEDVCGVLTLNTVLLVWKCFYRFCVSTGRVCVIPVLLPAVHKNNLLVYLSHSLELQS